MSLPAPAVRQQLPDIEAMLAMLRGELKPARSREITAKLMVNAVPDYVEHSKVVNGCSDLFVAVFGERHARSAIGVGSLPFGITVEIEAIVEVEWGGPPATGTTDPYRVLS